jgi:hypothetical protein
LNPKRIEQNHQGTSYKKSDLQSVREFDLDETIIAKDFLNKLRALTTNNLNEMAFYMDGNKKIGVRVEFIDLQE